MQNTNGKKERERQTDREQMSDGRRKRLKTNTTDSGDSSSTNECPICFDNFESSQWALFPCTHGTCDTCFERCDACPICRTGKDGESASDIQNDRQERYNRTLGVSALQRFIANSLNRSEDEENVNETVIRISTIPFEGGDGDSPLNFHVSSSGTGGLGDAVAEQIRANLRDTVEREYRERLALSDNQPPRRLSMGEIHRIASHAIHQIGRAHENGARSGRRVV